jgi:hypothetical protein
MATDCCAEAGRITVSWVAGKVTAVTRSCAGSIVTFTKVPAEAWSIKVVRETWELVEVGSEEVWPLGRNRALATMNIPTAMSANPKRWSLGLNALVLSLDHQDTLVSVSVWARDLGSAFENMIKTVPEGQ